MDRWKTNGDFVQALRTHPELRDELREIVRDVEQVQFGAAQADAARYGTIRAKVLAIVSRSKLAVFRLLAMTASAPAKTRPTRCESSRLVLAVLTSSPCT